MDKDVALPEAIDWLLMSQERMADDGMGSYHLVDGWTSSYPETTGYIIPTLIRYGSEGSIAAAIRAADWLITIQKPSGGWQSMRIDDDRPEVVFNTGQVMRGLIAAYEHTHDKKYLDSARKAADWLVSIQEDDGRWEKHVFMGVSRVYDSYVVAPLIKLGQLAEVTDYVESGKRNLSWIMNKQLDNGWFPDCDNTTKHNDRPIIHTIAYTADGLIESGILLNDQQVIGSGKRTADSLLDRLDLVKKHGRWDKDWNGSEDLICTGGAQIGITWLRLYSITKEQRYLEGASDMASHLCMIQSGHTGDARGALQGSYPLWGRYEKFAFPNWATKYHADLLMMEKEARDG